MQPSSSKESQHRSWLNAQTRCAMEQGGDKPWLGRPEVTQRSGHPSARKGGSRGDQTNQTQDLLKI